MTGVPVAMAVANLMPVAMMFNFFPMAVAMVMTVATRADNNCNSSVCGGGSGGKAHGHCAYSS